MANGDIPFKRETGGKYENKSLPSDQADFFTALTGQSLPSTESALMVLPDGSAIYLNAAALANFLGTTTDGALNAAMADPTSNGSYLRKSWTSDLSYGSAALRPREIQHWWNAIYRTSLSGATTRATMIVWGDSVALLKTEPQYLKLWSTFGFGGYLGVNFNYGGGYSLSGGAAYYNGSAGTAHPEAYVYWGTGAYFTLPSGGTIERGDINGQGGSTIAATTRYLKVFYEGGDAGAGVFKIQVRTAESDWADLSGYTAIDATTGTGQQALTIDLGSQQKWAYRFVGVSGGTTIIQQSGLFNATGVAIVEIQKGGTNLYTQNTWDQSRFNVVMNSLRPDMLVTEMKIETDNGQSVTTQLTNFEALWNNSGWGQRMDICYIGTSQDLAGGGTGVDAQNIENQAFAKANGRSYWESTTMGISFARLVQAYGDSHAVTGITRSGTTATLTTSDDNLLGGSYSANTYYVAVDGANQSDYVGVFPVLARPSSTTLTYTVANSPTTPATANNAGFRAVLIDGTHLNSAAQSSWSDAWARDMRLFGSQIAPIPATPAANSLTAQQLRRQVISEKLDAGAGLSINGSSYSALAAAPSIGTGDFTINIWMYVPTTAENGATTRGWFALSPNTGTSSGTSLLVYIHSSDELRISLSGTTASDWRAKCQSAFCATYGGGWHLLTIARVSTRADLLVSVDNVALGNQWDTTGTYFDRTSGTPPAWTASISSSYLLIGRATGSDAIFKLAEFGIWTSYLSATEQTNYFYSGLAPASPAQLYRFREGSGLFTSDASGNARHMTFTTALWWRPRYDTLTATASLNLSTGAKTVTVTGAGVGDMVTVCRNDGTASAAAVFGNVTATDTVTVTSPGTTDTSVSYRVKVWK